MPIASRATLRLTRLIQQSNRIPTSTSSLNGSFVCARCLARPSSRPFSSTSTHLKKSSSNPKSARKTPHIDSPTVDRHIPDNKATRNKDAEPDPYDQSELQAGIDKAITRLKAALTKTRDAGRVSTEMLEALPVEVNVKGTSGTAHKEHTRLGDLASVVPKGGRTMQVFASQEAHVKPLVAAIQASPYSLAPEAPAPAGAAAGGDGVNPLCITVPVPPVTAETRAAAAAEAKKCLERAQLEVRNARGDAQKRHKTMEKQKLVVVDELRKAHKGMEEVAKKGADEAKRVFDGAVKALQQ